MTWSCHTLATGLSLVLLLTGAAADGPWNSRRLSRYVRLRSGGPSRSPDKEGRVWRGRGHLSNTLSGRPIAVVESLERCTAIGDCEIETDRVLVYRDGNGTRLAAPLRYAHNVTMQLNGDGHLLLRTMKEASGGGASDTTGDGAAPARSVVASAWAAGRGISYQGVLRRALFRLSVRPVKDDAASAEGPPREDTPANWPRAANTRDFGVTREEYSFAEPSLPGQPCTMTYKRTGRCPHWVGGGVCTLELECTTGDVEAAEAGGGGERPWWRRWQRRLGTRGRRSDGREGEGIVPESPSAEEGSASSAGAAFSTSWERQVDALTRR